MIQLHELSFQPYIAADAIHSRIAQLGAQLSERYRDKEPVFLVVMKGAFMFAAELLQHFTPSCTVHFVRIQSYVGTAAGSLTMFEGLPEELDGRDVVIVEDIIDSGNTVSYILNKLLPLSPASVYTVALLQKDIPRTTYTSADLVAFHIPNVFVVGFGLDYDQLGRNIPCICQRVQ